MPEILKILQIENKNGDLVCICQIMILFFSAHQTEDKVIDRKYISSL